MEVSIDGLSRLQSASRDFARADSVALNYYYAVFQIDRRLCVHYHGRLLPG